MQNWYAIKLRFIVLLETTGSEEANDSICLLRGDSFAAAFARALRIGHDAEIEYIGGTGERVRWRLKELSPWIDSRLPSGTASRCTHS